MSIRSEVLEARRRAPVREALFELLDWMCHDRLKAAEAAERLVEALNSPEAAEECRHLAPGVADRSDETTWYRITHTDRKPTEGRS